MPKYRLLTADELTELRPEFIKYLIVNGIAAEDWEKMTKSDPDEADKVVDLFSDVVFEGVMRKVKFLELRSKTDIKVFQCLEEQLVLVGMTCDDSAADFSNSQYLHSAMLTPPEGLKVYTTTKEYEKSRELEIFEMTEKGCLITDGQLFTSMSMALPTAD